MGNDVKYTESVSKVTELRKENPDITAQDIKKELGCSLREAKMYLSGALYLSLCDAIMNK